VICLEREKKDRFLIGGHLGEFLGGETGINLDEVAAGVEEPEFV
jgi:hypothetical protein